MTDRLGDPARLRAEAAWLGRLARTLVRTSEDAQDVAQETWLARFRAGPGASAERSWLSTVARNFARRRWREEGRRTRRHRAAQPLAPESSPSSEDVLARHEAQRVLMNLVSDLEEPYRSTVLLRYAEDVSPAEIARRQGVPAGTVRWRLKVALDELRRGADARFGGDRRIALRSLVPGGGVGWLRSAMKGGVDMQLGLKLGAAVGGLIAVAAAVVVWQSRTNAEGTVRSAAPPASGRVAERPTPSKSAALAPPRFDSSLGAYDPMRSTASPMSLFEGESRDEVWASAMEAIIREGLGADLRRGAPEAELSHVECRDLSCYYEITTPQAHAMAAQATLQYVFYGSRCFPRGVVRVVDSKPVFAVVCLNGPDRKDLEPFKKMMVVQRENVRRAKGSLEENVARMVGQFGPTGPKVWKR